MTQSIVWAAGDMTAVIQAALNAASASGGDEVLLLPSTSPFYVYCGVTVPSGVILRGSSQYGTVLTCGDHDVTTVTIEGVYSRVENMTIHGRGAAATDTFSITQPAVLFNGIIGPCGDCTLRDVIVRGGANAIKIWGAGDANLEHVYASYAYGSASVYAGAPVGSATGGWFRRVNVDMEFPNGIPVGANGSVATPTWTPSTTYAPTGGEWPLVVVGGYILQLTQAGTSGASPPSLACYGAAITDGTAQWQLVAPVGYTGMQFDTGCIQFAVEQLDATCGGATYGVRLTNTLGGNPPTIIEFSGNPTFGNVLSTCLDLVAGAGVLVDHGTFDTGLMPNAIGVNVEPTFGGSVKISDSFFFTLTYGVLLDGGSDCKFVGNTFKNITGWCFVSNGCYHFHFKNNSCGNYGSLVTGGVNGGYIVRGGDYYWVEDNDCSGSTLASSPGNGAGSAHGIIGGNF
jgi:hypothetical protein